VEIPEGAGKGKEPGRFGGQAEDQVSGNGALSGRGIATEIGMDIQAEPYETSDAAEADLVGAESGGVAGGNAGHLCQVLHGPEFHVARPGQLAHGIELAGDTLASGDARLGTASENLFDGEESRVVDAFSEGEIEGVGRGYIVEGQHLKGFEDGKRDAAGRLDGGEIDGRRDRTSPLQSQGVGDFLFGGKAEFFDPFTDFSIAGAALGFESGANFGIGELAASDHQELEGNTVGRRRRWSDHVQARELASEGGFQAPGLAIEDALEEGSVGATAVAETVPE